MENLLAKKSQLSKRRTTGVLNMKLKILEKPEKVVGYVLLAVGVGMIFVSVYMVFSVFTGASIPPLLFDFSDISFLGAEIMSGEGMNLMVAMGFWYVLMFFVMWSGGKLASLGVSLIKEVKLRAVREDVGEEVEVEKEKEAMKKEN